MSDSNAAFMEQARKLIAADPNHPLRGLLDASGNWLARSPFSEAGGMWPPVQAGHLESRWAGGDRLALQDGFSNQQEGRWVESLKNWVSRDAVEIGGIPVERETAEMWERYRILRKGTTAAAKHSSGWRKGDRLTSTEKSRLQNAADRLSETVEADAVVASSFMPWPAVFGWLLSHGYESIEKRLRTSSEQQKPSQSEPVVAGPDVGSKPDPSRDNSPPPPHERSDNTQQPVPNMPDIPPPSAGGDSSGGTPVASGGGFFAVPAPSPDTAQAPRVDNVQPTTPQDQPQTAPSMPEPSRPSEAHHAQAQHHTPQTNHADHFRERPLYQSPDPPYTPPPPPPPPPPPSFFGSS